MNTYSWKTVLVLGIFFLFFTCPAQAHRVTIFCWPEGGLIHSQSKFQPGGAVKNGTVQVFVLSTGKLLLKGRTNAQGLFSFAVPENIVKKREDLNVVIRAGMGHKGAWKLTAADYVPELQGKDASAQSATSASVETPQQGLGPASALTGGLDAVAMKRLLDAELDAKLGPVMRELAAMQVHHPSFSEVLGGIGYIFGIMGIIMYFKARER